MSRARASASAAYESGLFEVRDVVVDDHAWTSADDDAFREHVRLNPAATLHEPGASLRQALDELTELEIERSRMVAQQQRVMVAIAGGAPRSRPVTVWDEDDEPRTLALTDDAVELIAVVLHRSPGTVRRQLATARTLVRLPRTLAAVESGSLGADHAEQVARGAHDLHEDLWPRYEHLVLGRLLSAGAARTPGEAASVSRRVRARLDPRGEERRRSRARRHEDVRIWAEEDGLACLQARLPLADAARVHAALDARARLLPYDPDHSMGVRRAAALVDTVCGGALDAGVALGVTVDLPVLLGLADDPAFVDWPIGAPEPITAGALRELLSDPRVPVTVRRLVVDPATGCLLDRGRSSYRVPESLRAFLVARDGTCRFPGCARRAGQCDMDHVRPWDEGGGTDRSNLVPLCRRHHLLKTHGGWSIVDQRTGGAVVWRAPDGRHVVTRPWRSDLSPPEPSPPEPSPPEPTRSSVPTRRPDDPPF
jgi:hypothetical protein